MRARAFLQLGINKDEKRSNPRCKEVRGTFHLVVRSWCKPNRVNLIRLFAIVLLFCSYRPSYAIVVGEGFTPLGYAPFETRDPNWHAGVGGLNFGATPYCTAQPIARSILLTAAHCTSSFTTHFASRFSVDSTNDGEFDFDFGIQSYVDHPGWSNDGRATRSADEYRHDIAVLLLDGDLPLEVPIYRMLPVHYGAPVTLVGYGRQGITLGGSGAFIHDNDDLGATDKWLGHNVVDPYVTRNGTIPELFRTTFDRRSPSEFVTPPSGCVGPPGRQLCANPGVRAEGFGFQEGTTLQGDSGSGMFYNPASARFYTNPNGTGAPGGTSKLTPNEYFLVGITSHGNTAAEATFIEYGKRSGFVSVGAHFDWISQTVKSLTGEMLGPMATVSSSATSFYSDDIGFLEASIVPPPLPDTTNPPGISSSAPEPSVLTLVIASYGLLISRRRRHMRLGPTAERKMRKLAPSRSVCAA